MPETPSNDVSVVNNAEEKRFEVREGNHVAVAEYILAGNRIVLTHTEVPPSMEGRGIASHLARTAMAYARDHHLKIMPLCPYMAAFMRRHPEYHDLLAEGFHV